MPVVYLSLTLNIFDIFSVISLVDFEQVNVYWITEIGTILLFLLFLLSGHYTIHLIEIN